MRMCIVLEENQNQIQIDMYDIVLRYAWYSYQLGVVKLYTLAIVVSVLVWACYKIVHTDMNMDMDDFMIYSQACLL